jgi:hypothetical protein
MNSIEELSKWSNLKQAQINAEKYLGKDVELFVSEKKNKKIDVYDIYGNLLASVGDPNYLDYPSFLRYCGKKIADEKRKLSSTRTE